jgi:aspartate/methionine/tyrosine aminotransferase
MQVSEQARYAAARGVSIIPTFGSPTLVMPPHVQDAVHDAAGRVFEHDTRGSLELRKVIADNLKNEFGVFADPSSELLITHGAMHGLGVTFRALLEAGDEIIVPAPTFFFDHPIRQTGALPQYVDCLESENWRWDIPRFEKALTPKTRAILVCNPTNPTAYVPSRDEVKALLDWAAANNLTVIADEAYARYVYDDAVFTPQMSFRDRYDKLVTVTSLTKNYGFSNWRVGYVHAPEPLLSKIHRQFEWDTLDVGPVPQAAAAAAISGPQEWVTSVLSRYEGNRDRLLWGLDQAGLKAVKPVGGPFAFVDFAALGLHSEALEAELLSHGIAAVAGDAFMGPDTFARIMFGGSDEALTALTTALMKIMSHRDTSIVSGKLSDG